jgi:hypothetical protein
LRRAVLIVLLLSIVPACAVQHTQAGQAGPPFYLWVMFRAHTSIWTKDFGRSARTTPLLNCLHTSGSVQVVAWPD